MFIRCRKFDQLWLLWLLLLNLLPVFFIFVSRGCRSDRSAVAAISRVEASDRARPWKLSGQDQENFRVRIKKTFRSGTRKLSGQEQENFQVRKIGNRRVTCWTGLHPPPQTFAEMRSSYWRISCSTRINRAVASHIILLPSSPCYLSPRETQYHQQIPWHSEDQIPSSSLDQLHSIIHIVRHLINITIGLWIMPPFLFFQETKFFTHPIVYLQHFVIWLKTGSRRLASWHNLDLIFKKTSRNVLPWKCLKHLECFTFAT